MAAQLPGAQTLPPQKSIQAQPSETNATSSSPAAQGEVPKVAIKPVVVELFTSQGCSSCPPADRLMNDLADRPDLIALSLPIDYWDGLGWPDTFADHRNTERQNLYAEKFGHHKYTPQIVINGVVQLPGNKKEKVLKLIADQENQAAPQIPITASWYENSITLIVRNTQETWTGGDVDIILAPFYSHDKTVNIKAGENKGATVTYSHIVSGLTTIGSYGGRNKFVSIQLDPDLNSEIDSCAILLQNRTTGAILGAVQISNQSARQETL